MLDIGSLWSLGSGSPGPLFIHIPLIYVCWTCSCYSRASFIWTLFIWIPGQLNGAGMVHVTNIEGKWLLFISLLAGGQSFTFGMWSGNLMMALVVNIGWFVDSLVATTASVLQYSAFCVSHIPLIKSSIRFCITIL